MTNFRNCFDVLPAQSAARARRASRHVAPAVLRPSVRVRTPFSRHLRVFRPPRVRLRPRVGGRERAPRLASAESLRSCRQSFYSAAARVISIVSCNSSVPACLLRHLEREREGEGARLSVFLSPPNSHDIWLPPLFASCPCLPARPLPPAPGRSGLLPEPIYISHL